MARLRHLEATSLKNDDDDEDNDAETRQAQSRTPATFEGRLHLEAFKYTTTTTTTRARRNPPRAAKDGSHHHSPPAPLVASPSPIPSPSSKKRHVSPSTGGNKKLKRSSGCTTTPSTYAHLPLLPDAIAPNLLVLFVGLNPGIATARSGHAYAHPSNLFWKLLHSSGVTPRRCHPHEDRQMPETYSLGLTNIVARPSRNGAELSRAEMDAGVAVLEDKARRWRPETMCIVGKSIWESIWRVRHGKPVGTSFRYGWQHDAENMGVVPGQWDGARVFVASSTSGLAATLLPAEKERIWAELGAWVKKRRADRENAHET